MLLSRVIYDVLLFLIERFPNLNNNGFFDWTALILFVVWAEYSVSDMKEPRTFPVFFKSLVVLTTLNLSIMGIS